MRENLIGLDFPAIEQRLAIPGVVRR
jgi:hypothetical protein